MQVDVLGPVRVRVDDREVDLGGPRSRALVARLAIADGRSVTATTLIDDLWGTDVPDDARGALQSVVSRARRRLPPGVLASSPAGYALTGAQVDATRFERLLAEGRAEESLGLWRDAPFADVTDVPFVEASARRLDELRLAAVEACLAPRVATDPTVVAELAEELGVDPSARLQDLHLAILRGDGPRPRRQHELPAAVTSFVGRENAIADVADELGRHRLVTLLGPGGAGKTRLSIETARATADGAAGL